MKLVESEYNPSMSLIDTSFVSLQQNTVAETSGLGAEYHKKTKHLTQECVGVDTAAEGSAYAEIAPEVHCCVQYACQMQSHVYNYCMHVALKVVKFDVYMQAVSLYTETLSNTSVNVFCKIKRCC